MRLAATESPFSAGEKVAPPGQRWRTRMLALPLWLLLIVPLAATLRGNASWLLSFWRDFAHWVGRPEVAGGFTVPTSLAVGLAIIVACGAAGWCASSLIVANTALDESPGFRLGLAIVAGVCIAGYCGMVAVTTGRLEKTFLIGAMVILGSVVVGLLFLTRNVRQAIRVTIRFRRPNLLTLGCLAAASLVVVLTAVHAALSPVTEWDATIYHAGAAKLWFLEAPNPPVIYGPSVGIEISANYPPLFPAVGAALDVLVGSFQDIYLRLVSPLILAALFLMIHGYARHRIGSTGAAWAVILTAGAPLIVLYGAWTTGYMLLAALWFGVVVLCDLAVAQGRQRLWLGAGVLAGLAILTHFYGLPVLAVGPLALLLRRPSRSNLIGAAIFLCTALLVASPWLIRNTILLHDPLFPVPLPFFHPIGLTEPLWGASQAEIRNNALGQWQGRGLTLYRDQLMTVVFDRHLLPVGAIFAIATATWQALRGNRWALYLLAVITVLIGTIVAPGWFWLRVLLPVVPIGAILTAGGIDLLARGELAWRRQLAPAWKAVTGTSQLALFCIAALTGVSLAIAGPNQDTWTTLLTGSQHDFMAPVRNLGSTADALYNVFGGDSLSWAWLNANLQQGRRVATLDGRLYYFDRPQDVFYLDGSEAGPLLHLRTPEAARSFLSSHGVRFVMIPGWASSPGPTRHPSMDLLPLISMLGGQSFPIAAAFVDIYPEPTLIYAVGPYERPVQMGVYPGLKAGLPALSATGFTLAAGDTSPRLIVPVLNGEATSLRFRYKTQGSATLTLNRWDPTRHVWVYGAFTSVPAQGGISSWHQAEVTLPVTSGYIIFGLYASGGDVDVRDLAARNPSQPIVVVAGNGTSRVDGSYTLTTDDTLDRILAPPGVSMPTILSMQYRGHGGGYFDLNYHDVSADVWSTVASARVGDKGWKTIATPLLRPLGSTPFSEYAIFSSGSDLDIRQVMLTTEVVIISPVVHEPSSDYVIPKGSVAARVLVPLQEGRAAAVRVQYVDTPGSFALNVLDESNGPSWRFGQLVRRSGRGSLKTVLISLPPGPARIVQIGPFAYSGPLLLQDVSVVVGPVQRYGHAVRRQPSCDSSAHGCQY